MYFFKKFKNSREIFFKINLKKKICTFLKKFKKSEIFYKINLKK